MIYRIAKLGAALLLLAAPFSAYASAFGATENFDSYSTAASLSAQNGGSGFAGAWSSPTSGSYVMVSSPTYGSSAEALSVSRPVGGGTTNETRQMSVGVDSGDMYMAIQWGGSTVAGCFVAFELNSSGTPADQFYVEPVCNGANVDLHIGGTTDVVLLASMAANTWYIVHVNFVSATQAKVQVSNNCAAYGAYSSTLTYGGSMSSPTFVSYQVDKTPTFYWDNIQPADPCVVASTNTFSFWHFFGF